MRKSLLMTAALLLTTAAWAQEMKVEFIKVNLLKALL